MSTQLTSQVSEKKVRNYELRPHLAQGALQGELPASVTSAVNKVRVLLLCLEILNCESVCN